MANYDRQIIVPYLQDLCAMECILSNTEKDIQACNDNIARTQLSIQKIRGLHTPQRPEQEGSIPTWIVGLVVGIPLIVFGLWFWLGLNGNILADLLGIGAVLFGTIVFISLLIASHELKKESSQKYAEKMREYSRVMMENNSIRSELPALNSSLTRYHQEMSQLQTVKNNVKSLLEKLYDVNIIPRQYRNIYAAYYLYDFMSTSRETDLEKVIQTFVLEEIKQRLDKIIMQNNQVLINQRVQIAMQEQQNRMLAENHREEMRNIARLEANQELQLDYQKMIVANQEVTNYILAEDYFRKYDKRIPF